MYSDVLGWMTVHWYLILPPCCYSCVDRRIGRDFEGNYNDALEYAHQESGEGDVRYIAEKSPALPIFLKMDEKGWSRVTWQSGYFGSLADIAQSIVMSALPPKADMCSATRHVRYVPIADIAGKITTYAYG